MQQRNKNYLSAPALIRKLLAGFLLLVFAFGITPKRTLHNIIATHKDGKANGKHDHPGTCVSKAVFNCQCDNLVSESPFVAATFSSDATGTFYFSAFTDRTVECFLVADLCGHNLRGPPAC